MSDKKTKNPETTFFEKIRRDFVKKGILYAQNYISYLENYPNEYFLGVETKRAIKLSTDALNSYKEDLKIKQQFNK